MEVKAVFSYISSFFVRLRGMETPARIAPAHEKRASSSFNYESNRTGFAVPGSDEKNADLSRAH
jgi:hypothetical protein